MTKGQTLPRRMLSCGLLATALAVTAMQASAQDVTVRGAGTCQAYLDAKRNYAEGENQALNQLTWLLGYLSGLAAATHVDILGNGDSAESIPTWVDIYCHRYPSNYLSDAGDLYYKFRKERMAGASAAATQERK